MVLNALLLFCAAFLISKYVSLPAGPTVNFHCFSTFDFFFSYLFAFLFLVDLTCPDSAQQEPVFTVIS